MPLRISLRVICFRAGDSWYAHCLEFDVIGDGATKAEALAQLAEAVRIQVDFSLEHNNLNNLFSPADADLFLKFAAGKTSDLPAGELRMNMTAIAIDAVEVRELEEALVAA